jgi:heme exporter protein CcmD
MEPATFTMPHWPFVAASYAVFAVLIAADMISTTISKRRVLRDLRGRLARSARREAA